MMCINDLDGGIYDFVAKVADDTKMGGAAGTALPLQANGTILSPALQ